ncbi:MAG: hypothetical protein U1E65_34950 [Myxococcota bacterium]
MRRLYFGLLILSACVDTTPKDGPLPSVSPTPSPSVSPILGDLGPEHPGVIKEPPPPSEAGLRSRRRMDLDQLDAAVTQVTGGIGWTEQRGNSRVDLFQDLAATLGKPDFAGRTEEDLVPSAMFQKFLDDAARAVCTQLVTEDPGRADGSRTFFTAATVDDTYQKSPAAVEANLRALLLRFHGRKIAPGATELDPWTWLMKSAEHAHVSPANTWRAVCIALIVHPDFYSY